MTQQELKDNEFHYTPEIARTKAKEAFNWRDYIQKYIDKYVDIAVKDAKFTTYVEIPKLERFNYDETIEHVLIAARQLGWHCAPSSKSVIGYVYIDLFWDEE